MHLYLHLERLEKHISQTKNNIAKIHEFGIYPQMLAPAGVQRALDTVKVVVKEVDVEMEVVVIQ